MSDPTPPSEEPSFEDLVADLEAVVRRMGAPEIGIEQAADLYERATKLHDLATARLEAVEARIAQLSGEGELPD